MSVMDPLGNARLSASTKPTEKDTCVSLESFAETVPKVELHVHLDGAWDIDYLFQLVTATSPAEADSGTHHSSLPLDAFSPDIVYTEPISQQVIRLRDEVSALRDKVHVEGKEKEAWERFKQLVCVSDKIMENPSLAMFLAPFKFFMPIVVAAHKFNPELHLAELAYRFVKRQKESNVLYTEVRYNPHLLVSQELLEDPDDNVRIAAVDKAIQAVTNGLRRGEQDFGIRVNQILCILNFNLGQVRDFPALFDLSRKRDQGADDSGQDATLATDSQQIISGKTPPREDEAQDQRPMSIEESINPRSRIVGLDVAAGYSHFAKRAADSPEKAKILELIQSLVSETDLKIAIHAGETREKNGEVENAIVNYKASRIGHGYNMFLPEDSSHDAPQLEEDDDSLACVVIEKKPKREELANKDVLITSTAVHFEMCPTSSRQTGAAPWDLFASWEDHPVLKVLRHTDCRMNAQPLPYETAGVSINTDDPSLSGITLNGEYLLCLREMKITREEIGKMTLMALDAAFMPDAKWSRTVPKCGTSNEKSRLREKIIQAYRENYGIILR